MYALDVTFPNNTVMNVYVIKQQKSGNVYGIHYDLQS